MPQQTDDEWYTPGELAKRWKLSPSTIYRMHRLDPKSFGRIISGSLRIHRSEVDAIEKLDLQRQTAKAVRNHRRQKSYAAVQPVDHFPNMR